MPNQRLEDLIIEAKVKLNVQLLKRSLLRCAPNMSICQTGDCFRDCDFDERVKYLLMVALRDRKPIL